MTQLDALENVLKGRRDLHTWRARRTEVERQEIYLVARGGVPVVDQERRAEQATLILNVDVEHDDGSLGNAEVELKGSDDGCSKVEGLVASARLGREQRWSLPESAPPGDEVAPWGDATVWSDLEGRSQELAQQLGDAVRGTTGARFNSGELHVAREVDDTRLSSGFAFRERRSRMYAEVCFTATDAGRVQESLVTLWSPMLSAEALVEACVRAAEQSRRTLEATTPAAGEHAVLLPAAPLAILFENVLRQMRLEFRYHQMPHIAAGDALVPGYVGAPFRLYLDPSRHDFLRSRRYSFEGLPQEKLLVADGNMVVANPGTKQIADYLSLPPTMSNGGVTLETDGEELESLRRAHPRVLEIIELSDFSSSPMDLTFGSEIRLARLIDNESGRTTYVKGGSISGSFRGCFARARWSSTAATVNDFHKSGLACYHGPSHVLVDRVNVGA